MGYSVLATNKFLVGKLPYDLETDLAPIVHVGYIPLILVTQPAFPANSVKELIALLKANPGKYSYASGGAGAGAHLSGELFKHLAGVDTDARAVQGQRAGAQRPARRPRGDHVRHDHDLDPAREVRQAQGARDDGREALAARARRADDDRGRACPASRSARGT